MNEIDKKYVNELITLTYNNLVWVAKKHKLKLLHPLEDYLLK